MSKSRNADKSRSRCSEQDTLKVMEQFKQFYEEKLEEVDSKGGGDCLEIKLKIQRRWIDDLTEQTQMMARVVKELEDEATARVHMLEDKLRQTSKSAYEKVFYLENDVKNLLEFIRRARDDKKWHIDGLQFYEVSHKDLFGNDKCEIALANGHPEKVKHQEQLPVQSEDTINPTYDQITQQLKNKTEELEELRRSMLDMRNALTEEVACKHDTISALRKDLQQLEERCVQSDKQTAFKDDIIKELRKEIKQIRLQKSPTCRSRSVRHCLQAQDPKYSTVIFINDSQRADNVRETSSNLAREIPVKEKSKFTVTNFREKVCEQGFINSS